MSPVILVVDDETDTADLLGMILGMHFPGAKVCVAYGGQSALDLVEHQPLRAAVLDLEMPGFDGPELAAALREKFADSPPVLIALSGNVKRLSNLKGSELFDHLMSKPTDVDSLLKVIGQSLGKR